MNLLLTLMFLLGVIIIFGYIRPWWVLWWNEAPNRLKVLQYYGSIFLLLLLIWLAVQT